MAFIVNEAEIEAGDNRIKNDSVSFFWLKEVNGVYTKVVEDWHIDFLDYGDQICCDQLTLSDIQCEDDNTLSRHQSTCSNGLGDFKHHGDVCQVTAEDLSLLLLTVSHKNGHERMLDSFGFFKPQQESSKKFQWGIMLIGNDGKFHLPLINAMIKEKENQAWYVTGPEKLDVWITLEDELCEQSEAKLVAKGVELLWGDKRPQLLMVPCQPDSLHLLVILQLDEHNPLIWLADKCSLISGPDDCSGVGIKVYGNQRRANQVAGGDDDGNITDDLNASAMNNTGIFDLVILIPVPV